MADIKCPNCRAKGDPKDGKTCNSCGFNILKYAEEKMNDCGEDDRENQIENMMPDSQDYLPIRSQDGQVIGYVFLDNSYAIEPNDWLDMALTPKLCIDPNGPPDACGWLLSPRTELRTSKRSPEFPHEYEDPAEAAQERPPFEPFPPDAQS